MQNTAPNQPSFSSHFFFLHSHPASLHISIFFLWLPICFFVSVAPKISIIALAYVILGLVIFSIVTTWRNLQLKPFYSAAMLAIFGCGLAACAPFIVNWKPQFRLFYIPFYSSMKSLPMLLGESIHANVFAGALVITLPVILALAFSTLDKFSWIKYFAGASAIYILLMLMLSQSRGGYLAISAALMTMLLLRWPRLGYLVPIGLVGIFLLIRGIGIATILDQFSSDSALGGWSGRLEIWQTSLTAIADFPFTGIGIGTFTTVIPLLYPLSFPIESYPHAHNLFLQIALDLGLPGLIAYLALLINLIAMLIVTLRKAPRHTMIHTLAIGAAGSLAGMLTHGLLDAVTWGTKLSFLPWILFALITQLFLHVQEDELISTKEGNPKSA